jgi:ABC-2 type transport system ATP-binding protein
MTELAGASGGIELELVEIADRPTSVDDVAARLVAAGAGVRRNGTTLSVVGLTDDELFDLAARSVVGAGARLRRLGHHRRTLDDIFADDRLGPSPARHRPARAARHEHARTR